MAVQAASLPLGTVRPGLPYSPEAGLAPRSCRTGASRTHRVPFRSRHRLILLNLHLCTFSRECRSQAGLPGVHVNSMGKTVALRTSR